jgi:DNA-binding transcriptional LysR family regulator
MMDSPAPKPTSIAPLDSARLHAFLAVAQQRGFSRAARALGKTQSSVSQAIAQLERDLGEKLFDRIGRGASLTVAGQLLVGHAEEIFEQMRRARAHLEAARTLETGELVIGTSDTLACHLLPPVLAAFRARFPRVDLRLDNRPSPATAAAVAERRVHVGVVSLPLQDDQHDNTAQLTPVLRGRIDIEPLVAQVDLLICRPDHPLARKRGVRLADLVPHPLLLLDRTTASRAYLAAAFARAGLRPRITMEMSSVEVLKRLVELGFGISIVPAWAATREAAAGSLVCRPLVDLEEPTTTDRAPVPARSVGLVTPKMAPAPLPRATAAFVDLARAELPRAARASRLSRGQLGQAPRRRPRPAG